jgi:hypothetical protein
VRHQPEVLVGVFQVGMVLGVQGETKDVMVMLMEGKGGDFPGGM